MRRRIRKSTSRTVIDEIRDDPAGTNVLQFTPYPLSVATLDLGCYEYDMGALGDVKSLLLKYPITFLAFGAAAAAALPVVTVSTAPALRPWARRVLAGAIAFSGEARRMAAESQEAYADLLAEVELGGVAEVKEERRPAPRAAVAIAAPHRADPLPVERAASPMA